MDRVLIDVAPGYLSADALNVILEKQVSDLTLHDITTLLDASERIYYPSTPQTLISDILLSTGIPAAFVWRAFDSGGFQE